MHAVGPALRRGPTSAEVTIGEGAQCLAGSFLGSIEPVVGQDPGPRLCGSSQTPRCVQGLNQWGRRQTLKIQASQVGHDYVGSSAVKYGAVAGPVYAHHQGEAALTCRGYSSDRVFHHHALRG